MNSLREILIALGGTNKKILEGCPDSEKSKHIAYGILLLIPAFMGGVAMFFVAETLGIVGYAKCFMSLIWGLIVLAIDRALLITYHKKMEFKWKKDGLFILIRIILALFIGILISHPLVLKLFEQSVNEKLQDKLTTKIEIKKDEIEGDKKNELDKINIIRTQKDSIYKEYVYAANAESNGKSIDPTPIMHLTTSGKYGQKDHYNELIKGRDDAKEVYDSLTKKIAIVEAVYDSLKSAVEKDIRGFKSKDTLARIESLDELKQEKPIVSTVILMVLCFLIFLDITPLLVKLMSEYEVYEKRQEENQKYLQQECDVKFNEHKCIIKSLYDKMKEWHEKRIKDVMDNDTIAEEADLYNKLSDVFVADFSSIYKNENSQVDETKVSNSIVVTILLILCVVIFFIMNLITPGDVINAVIAILGPSAAGVIYVKTIKKNNKKTTV